MTARNRTPDRYRDVSVADVDVPLTAAALSELLLGRDAYRRTKFIVVRRGSETALVEIEKATTDPLFSPITAVRLLAGPEECAVVDAPDLDPAVPSDLAAAARRLPSPARCVIVHGRFEHVSFLLDPAPLRMRVLETVPPSPPKLVEQVRRVLSVADDLPPIEVEPVLVDLHDLARTRPSGHYLLPCRAGATAPPGARLDYLDELPPRGDWVLVGCERSRQIHRWVYGDVPPNVDSCPRAMASDLTGGEPTLTKCCLFEYEIDVEETRVTVPWGASLEEIRRGVAELAKAMEPAWAPG